MIRTMKQHIDRAAQLIAAIIRRQEAAKAAQGNVYKLDSYVRVDGKLYRKEGGVLKPKPTGGTSDKK